MACVADGPQDLGFSCFRVVAVRPCPTVTWIVGDTQVFTEHHEGSGGTGRRMRLAAPPGVQGASPSVVS